MMGDDERQLANDIEVDEAYIHPSPQRRSSAKAHNSQVVFGMVERGGKAKISHVKSYGIHILVPEIQKSIDRTASIYTDEHGLYRLLKRKCYRHKTINHSRQQYVVGHVHTQNVENFWSIFKRGIYGVYRHCDPKYLQYYANEYAFRYSYRKSNTPMFELVLGKVVKTGSDTATGLAN
jgi:hypothetical protein